MTITKLEELSSSRIRVYLDEEPAFALYKGEVRRFGLAEGRELTEGCYTQILTELLPHRAKLRCMNLLKSRAYTESQLRTKLQQGGYPEEVIEEAISYVASFHYVDDLCYAQDFIRYNQSRKSKKRLENDLRQKGISAETIAKAWDRWEAEGNTRDEKEQIRTLLKKRRFDRSAADEKELQRTYAFLARRGFEPEVIRSVLFSERE